MIFPERGTFFRKIVLFALICKFSIANLNIWPYPAQVSNGNGENPTISTNLGISCTCSEAPIKPRIKSGDCSPCTETITPAINRALERMFYIPFFNKNSSSDNLPKLQTVRGLFVTVNTSTTTDLQFPIDESYSINIQLETIIINSKNEWGAIWALETLISLSYYSFADNVYRLNCSLPLLISDFPRVSWRGVLVDTARHFLKISSLKNVVEGMAASKMNALHWHISDDQSFPLCLDSFPELCQVGAFQDIFGQSANYSKSSVNDLISFAKSRGVRVIPEMDFPGHSAILSLVYPSLYVTCSSGSPLPNPTTDDFYNFLDSLVEELSNTFPDSYLHMGGDEVDTTCWTKNQTVITWLNKNNITATQALEQFHIKIQNIVYSKNKTPIYWDEFWNLNPSIRMKNTVAEIRNDPSSLYSQLIPVITTGISEKWYLDRGISKPIFVQQAWTVYYVHDPFPTNITQIPYALGGEADLWSEGIDDTNLIPRLFPFASAIAEVLWSPASMPKNINEAESRLNNHRCLLVKRGVLASPITPGTACYSVLD